MGKEGNTKSDELVARVCTPAIEQHGNERTVWDTGMEQDEKGGVSSMVDPFRRSSRMDD